MLYLPATSKAWLLIGVDAPPGINVTSYVPRIALVADDGTEPAGTDWQTGTWIDGKAAILVGPGADVTYPAGEYMAWVSIAAGVETPVLPSGRVRVGDRRP